MHYFIYFWILQQPRLVQQTSFFIKNLNVGYFSHLIGLYSCVDPVGFVQYFPYGLQLFKRQSICWAPCIFSCSPHLHVAFWDSNLLFWKLKSNLPLCAQTRTCWGWFGGLQKLYFEFGCWKYWAKGNYKYMSLVCLDHCGFHIVHLTDFLPSLIMPGKTEEVWKSGGDLYRQFRLPEKWEIY